MIRIQVQTPSGQWITLVEMEMARSDGDSSRVSSEAVSCVPFRLDGPIIMPNGATISHIDICSAGSSEKRCLECNGQIPSEEIVEKYAPHSAHTTNHVGCGCLPYCWTCVGGDHFKPELQTVIHLDLGEPK